MLRIAAVLCIAAMACSGRSSIAIADLDQELYQARCEHLVRCKLFPDEVSCHASLRLSPDPSVSAAVAAHKIAYDGARARECVDATASRLCDATTLDAHAGPAARNEMLTGRVADGQSCSIDVECASGTCVLP